MDTHVPQEPIARSIAVSLVLKEGLNRVGNSGRVIKGGHIGIPPFARAARLTFENSNLSCRVAHSHRSPDVLPFADGLSRGLGSIKPLPSPTVLTSGAL
jgi:hypothetical protein